VRLYIRWIFSLAIGFIYCLRSARSEFRHSLRHAYLYSRGMPNGRSWTTSIHVLPARKEALIIRFRYTLHLPREYEGTS
jgi:hypothetical protein